MKSIDSWEGNGPFSFIIHDLYHLIRELQLSEGQSRGRFYMIDLLKAAESRYVPMLKEELYDKLIDGDLLFAHATSGELFKDRRGLTPDKFGRIFSVVYWHEEFKQVVLEDMVKKREFWKKEFDIDADSLATEERKLYDEILAKL